ncbi:ABC transporter ATP-binding protein [Nakamurella endophytica]|uniref:ABC transporter ATP-binding protein n=1 Tax=Nakamurella endophytica TaxID=1748367 RepID=A0A917ST18_9ACTN|nr:ATP-binding cassette domain-containing protein [Nakamurella endophytica]GGL94748.1 ABC transporter ATP-binding protein [Nakamurella endophytica]
MTAGSRAAASAALRISNLRAGYGKARVLHGLDLAVEPGEMVGVAGPNGVGKSTLLKAISGLMPRMADRMEFGGAPLKQSPVDAVVQGIAHVPEGRRVLADLTVEENLRIGGIGGRVQDFASVRQGVVDRFPSIVPLLHRKAGLLSGGQQQLVAIARGLVAQPRLLMVDELSLGLSPTAVASISAATVSSCRELGASLLWVDQNLAILGKHCDRVILLRDGVAVDIDPRDTGATNSAYF